MRKEIPRFDTFTGLAVRGKPKLIKLQTIYTHKHAARLFLQGGANILVKGGRKEAAKVARIIKDLAKREGVRVGKLLKGKSHAAGHQLRDAAGQSTGRTGFPHIQFDDIGGQHIFYSLMGVLIGKVAAANADTAAFGNYELDLTATYSDVLPGRSFANLATAGYWLGEDSYGAWLDWVNPLELVAMGGDLGRWIERECRKELLGVTLTISDQNGSPKRSYSFNTKGVLQSVGIGNNAHLGEPILGELYLQSIQNGSRTDDLLGSDDFHELLDIE